MAKLICGIDGCEWSPPSNTEKGLHHHQTVMHGADGTAVPAVRKKRGRKSKLDEFIQEQNIDTATAYVLAAKFPYGIAIEDIPRAIQIVKVVDRA